jgi:chromate transport protein ChrA
MNDEDHIKLADIGMRYGASMAISVALFAIGATVLLTTIDLYIQQIPGQFLVGKLISGVLLLVVGMLLTIWIQIKTKKKMNELKKSS